MYLKHFGLEEAPFSITPDPTFIYLSGRHRDALAHLLYGIGKGGSGGFVQLTGEVGTGKTTLCRALLEQVPEGTHIALVLNPLMEPVEMLAAVCEELGISTRGVSASPKGLVDRLNAFLLEAHRRGERVVLVIDEAQNLSPESLEQVRLLTNLETSKEKLLQIILLGQPELRELLRRRNLRQLAQRITARFHLTPLGPDDTARYVRHRLAVAGARRDPFRRSAMRALFRRSQGVPRLINIIADRSLTAAYAAETDRIGARMVNAAADEVTLGEPGVVSRRWPRYAAGALAVAVLVVGGLLVADRFGGRNLDEAVRAVARAAPAQADGDLRSEPASESATDGATGSGATIAKASPARTAPPGEAGGGTGGETGSPDPDSPSNAEPEPTWFEVQNLRAWQELAAAWGRAGDGALVEASCLGREGLGYACLRDTGNWLRIRQLGLPVVLELEGSGNLLLTGIQDDRLQVGAGEERRTVAREVIESRWLGDYYAAWPQAPDWPREVGRGDTGEAVDRIIELAGRSEPPYGGEATFGPEFERWLMAFQVRNGLEPDGIVGPKTLLWLMRFSIDEPRLLTAQGSGG